MKILILDQFGEFGGAQMCLLMSLEALLARGWEVAVGLPGNTGMFRRVCEMGLQTFSISLGPYRQGRKSAADLGRFLTQTPRLAAKIRSLARGFGADLLYLNGPRLLPAAALARVGIPVLFHAHSCVAGGAVHRLAGEALRRLPATVVACCRSVASCWKRFVEPHRVSIVFNGVAGPPAMRRRKGDHTTIGCIGRISPEKGQMEFVAAAAAIHRALPHCRFAIYGAPLFSDDAARYAERVHAAARGLPIEFPGWSADVYQALAQIDLLLVPSATGEATTRVIPEAFAAGVPVVAFASGGIPEVIEPGCTGFLVRSAEEMAACAIDLLCAGRDQLCSISQAARNAWETRFTPQCFQLRLLEAVKSAARSFG